MDDAAVKFFWDHVAVRGEDDCWYWNGKSEPNRYGKVVSGMTESGKRRWISAHRFSWILAYGEPPAGMHVLHSCDSKPCTNPRHLFLGTHADNMTDKVRKGRHEHGETAVRAKLDNDQVLDIIDWVMDGISQKRTAKAHGVCIATVNHIMRGRLWQHLTGMAKP